MDYEQKIKEAAKEHFAHGWEGSLIDAFIQGALWAYSHLWLPANGDSLSEIDREVIALVKEFGHHKVVFAHRVDENAEVHTSIDGKPFTLHPMAYDEGRWNQPNIKFWLDLELPKMEE